MKKATTKTNVKENTVKKTTTAKVETSSKTATTAKAESKSTTKMSSMVATLKSMLPNIKDKKLKAEVENSLKAVKSAKPEDVAALIARVIETGKTKTAVANETKPTVKKTVTKKTEDKSTEKKTAPKPTAKADPVKSVKTTGDFKPPIATLFPEEITENINGASVTLTKVPETDFTSIADFKKFIEEDMTNTEKIFVAAYWNKRHLKQYNYAALFNVPEAPKEFPNNLDLLQGTAISEKNKQFWLMSIYTDAMYVFNEEDFEPVEDKDPYNGDTYTVRVSNGMEFAVYVVKEEKPKPKAKTTAKKSK
jgi:hypothetical protein